MILEKAAKHRTAIFLVLIVMAAVGKRYFGGLFASVFAAMAAALFLLIFYDGLKSSYHRFQTAYGCSQRGINLYKEIIPPWLRGRASTETLIFREFFSRLLRITPPSIKLENETVKTSSFTLRNGDISPIIIPMAVIATLTDVPLTQLLVMAGNFHHAMMVHLVSLAAAIWGLIWITGDRFAVKTMSHYVHEGYLGLRVGYRWNCRIALSAINRCHLLDGSPREWRKRLDISKKNVWSVTPFEKPNMLLELNEKFSGDIHLVKMGAVVPRRQYLAIYVDKPNVLMRTISMNNQTCQI